MYGSKPSNMTEFDYDRMYPPIFRPSGRLAFRLNGRLMDDRNVSHGNRAEIIRVHHRVQEIIAEMKRLSPKAINELRQLKNLVRDCHNELQTLWGYAPNEELHQYEVLPHCKCIFVGSGVRNCVRVEQRCPLHGDLVKDPCGEI